jgi:hypothetical protein
VEGGKGGPWRLARAAAVGAGRPGQRGRQAPGTTGHQGHRWRPGKARATGRERRGGGVSGEANKAVVAWVQWAAAAQHASTRGDKNT